MGSASAQPQESGKTCACFIGLAIAKTPQSPSFLPVATTQPSLRQTALHLHTHTRLACSYKCHFLTFSPSVQAFLSPQKTAHCFLSWPIYFQFFRLRSATCSPSPRPLCNIWGLCSCCFSLLLQGRRRMGMLAKQKKTGKCTSLWRMETSSQGIAASLQSPPKEKGWKEMM